VTEQGVALTLREAAQRCDPPVSRRTLVRRLEAGAFPNAYRAAGSQGEGTGPWQLPVADLLAAGYQVRAEAEPSAPSSTERITQLEQANATLQARVGTLETTLALTETLAAERGAERDRLARLLELTPGDQVTLPGMAEQVRAPIAPEPARITEVVERSSWWRRLRR
jgi:hypothetical protein